eukprot:7357500-Lingulodinium_polyedra.AAC.1
MGATTVERGGGGPVTPTVTGARTSLHVFFLRGSSRPAVAGARGGGPASGTHALKLRASRIRE